MNFNKKVGNLATNVSVDESIEALITFMCDVLNDADKYRKILEDEYNDCKSKLQKKTSSVFHDDYTRIEQLCDKFRTQLKRFSKAFTQDYLDILTVALELYNLRVEHGSAMKEYDRFELEDKKFVKKATNLARKIERIIKKHDKLAVVYNTQIDKLDTFHKHLEKQLIIYTTNYGRKFVIPVKDYIAEFRSIKSDETTKKKGEIISDHLNDMLKRMSGNGDGSPLIRISKLEDVNFDRNAKDERKRKSEGSESDEAKKSKAARSDKPSSNGTQIPRSSAGNQYNDQPNVQRSSNASQEKMKHSEGLGSGSASLASKLDPNDRSRPETLTKSIYRSTKSKTAEDIREDKRKEQSNRLKSKSQNLVMSRRGVPQNLGEESDSDAVNYNQNENSSSSENSEPGNQNIAPTSSLKSDVTASNSESSYSYLEGSSESEPASLASEFENIGETGIINSQQIMDYPETDEEEIDESDDKLENDSTLEHLRNKELTTDLDPNDESSPKSFTENRYKGNRSKTHKDIREERKKNSKDKLQDLVIKRRGVEEEFGEESDSDAVIDSQNENSSSSDNSEFDDKFEPSKRTKVKFDLKKKDLDDKDRLQSKIDEMRKNLRKKRKINPEYPQISRPQVDDMVNKGLAVYKPTIFDRLLELERQKQIKKELISSGSITKDSVKLDRERHQEENSASISESKIAPISKLKSDIVASDSESSDSDSEDSSESESASSASESEEIGTTGMINSQQNTKNPETDGKGIDDSHAARKIDGPVEHLRSKGLTTHMDPNDGSSSERSTKNKYKGNRSKTHEDIRENIREERKKNSKDKSQNLVIKRRGVEEEFRKESDSDVVNDSLSENSSSSDNSEPDNKKRAPEKRLESDVTASELQGLQSDDKGSSDSDGSSDLTNDSGRLAQKRHREKNDDPDYDVLENFAPISKKKLVSRRRLKSDVSASDSESSDFDSASGDSDSKSSDSD